MIEADRVHSTPPLNTSANSPPGQPMTRDDELGMAWWNALTKQERAKWSTIAGNTGRVKDAWEAFKRGPVDQSPFPGAAQGLSRRHMLAGLAVLPAVVPIPLPGAPVEPDPIYAAIEAFRSAHDAHGRACDVLAEAETRFGFTSEEADAAWEAGTPASDAALEAAWSLATTPPTTPAGVAAVLRFANEIEDTGMEWPRTDTIGAEGWHYQLRATMAAAIEIIIRKGAA